MHGTDDTILPPSAIRLEICTFCQLQCPLCSRFGGSYVLGQGYLRSKIFTRFVDQNPYIRKVGLANQGEVFLNPDLPKILESANERKIRTSINGGANLNHASEAALDALVKFQTEIVRCAIDGATHESYAKYRIGGNLKTVIRNIQKLNACKDRYQSSMPRLIWQFIVFGHNEHEVERAALLAKMLKMEFQLRLNKNPQVMPVKDRKGLRKMIGCADRSEYAKKFKRSYIGGTCLSLWKRPQINWDGKLLGCPCNTWGFYSENVFEKDLMKHLNNDKMRYARLMLMGKKPPRKDIPCVRCHAFKTMEAYGTWITETEIHAPVSLT